jgi:2',3'-cyclic-nucleotide 2'-phosphodiesterase (5'-nucleotidase family)
MIGSPSHGAVEAVVNAGLMDIEGAAFNPEEPMTGHEFVTLLAKAFNGPEKPVDHAYQAVKDGWIDARFDHEDYISRAEAALAVYNIIGRDDYKSVTLFVTSDIHGHLIPYTPASSAVNIGSMARMAKVINDFKAGHENVIVLDGGDSPYNQNIANLFEGRSSVDVMNAMGYTATVLGNHDFDMSFENLEALAGRADYAFLSANTYLKDGSFPDFLEPSVKVEVDGLTIGVIGLTDDASKETTHYENTEEIDFADDIETAKELVPALDEETDVVIALSHLHAKNRVLPLEVSGIDVSVGGGNDLVGQPLYIGDTWLINPGKHGECLNQINLNIVDGQVEGLIFNQIMLNETMGEDEEVAGIINDYFVQMEDLMLDVVATSDVFLDGERETVRFKESNLGNLIADALREETGADFAFQNGGGIRASAQPGEITLEMVYAMLPFDNLVIVIEASGQTVWEALENSASNAGTAHGNYLQVSGLSYTYDISKPAGERMVSVTLPDGSPLDLEARYTVCVNDFMAGGGDGYLMLNVLNENNPDVPVVDDVKLVMDSMYFQRELFAEYLGKAGTVAPELEGRITELGN